MGNVTEIKTGIDRFLDLINDSEETKADAAASKLGVSAETIEIWAEILQQDSLVEIGYDGFGKMTVKPKASAPTDKKGKKTLQTAAADQKEEVPGRGFSILRNIRKKAVWKKNRESENKARYMARINKMEETKKSARKENIFSKILWRLGVKNKDAAPAVTKAPKTRIPKDVSLDDIQRKLEMLKKKNS